MLNLIKKPCSNFESRSGFMPEAVVIHIMDGTLIGTDSWFANPKSKSSAHYGIGVSGEVHQYLDESVAAWHTGVVKKPTWKLLKPSINPNKYTIGVEHEGGPKSVWTEEMKRASAELIHDVCKRWNIPIDRLHIIGHDEINSVTRGNCPSENKSLVDEMVSRVQDMAQVNKIEQAKTLIKQAIVILEN